MNIIRDNECVESFCWNLINKFGVDPSTFYLQHNYHKDGELMWSKKLSWEFLNQYNHNQWIPGTYDDVLKRPLTRLEFIERATHRSIIDVEIMLDIDDKNDAFLTFKTIKQKALYYYKKLAGLGYNPIIHFTGNKSYHISFIESGLRKLKKQKRIEWKRNFFINNNFDTDLLKSSENTTISMEGSLHYRSGKPKKRVSVSELYDKSNK